jgi:triosephosphate isomerase
MRKKIVAGNWKMNMDLAEGLKLAGSIDKYFKENPSGKALAILCTPYIHLAGAYEILKHGKVALGAQNCASEASGAFTGEVSAWMVKSTGAEYVIIGQGDLLLR